MNPTKEPEKKKLRSYIPALSVRYRILLYVVTIFCDTLAVRDVMAHYFSYAVSIIVYVLAAITLAASCCYIFIHGKQIIHNVIKPAIAANPFTNRLTTDYRWRTVLFAVPGMVSNLIFAAFNGFVGITARSAWFGTLAAYYLLLGIMRAAIVRQERMIRSLHDKEAQMRREQAVYCRNSGLFVLMAVVLAGAVVLLLHAQGGKNYPGYTIYAVAAYTFYKIIASTVQVIKVGKKKSPLLTITRRIGYMDACVSILILQTAMFASFAQEDDVWIQWMNGGTGTVVCLLVFGLGLQGIWHSRKQRELS